MSMPFYVAPEQLMRDKSEFARKNIARGRALVALTYTAGVLLVAENPSGTLHKISEIYDRIAFGGVGRFSEYDQLRQAGVRHADLKGYQYSREDVDARSLANAYGQLIGQAFTHDIKPLEVEILVTEVGEERDQDRLYHIFYDGNVVDETRFSVLPGDSEAISGRMEASYNGELDLAGSIKAAVVALQGDDRTLTAADLEVALLERGNGRRAFRRLTTEEITAALA